MRIRPKLRETRVLLHGAPGSARPTGERLRIRRSFLKISALLPGASGTPPPTGPLRIRRTWRISFVAAAWNAGDGVPYRAAADSPDVELIQSFFCLRVFCKRPHPFPPPAGEGVAHKGDRRGRTWRDRDVEMTAAGGICEAFYCLPAVTFSLFRHSPGGECHLPPLGEGRGGCECAGHGGFPLALLPARRGRRALQSECGFA